MTSATQQNPTDQYNWQGQVTESIRNTPSTNGAPPTGLQNEALNGLQGQATNPSSSSTTTLNYSYTRDKELHVSDSAGNSIRATRGAIPAITCNGTPQTVDINRSLELSSQGLQQLQQQLGASPQNPLGQLPPNALNTFRETLDAVSKVQHTSGTLTYEGQSPLSHLCRAGQAAGVIR